MAEGLGVAASAIAVVELSMKIISLCSQYLKDVKNAESDIAKLKGEVTNLKTVSESVRELLDTPQGTRLKTSQELGTALKSSQTQLGTVEDTLRSHINDNKWPTFRTMKWPFKSKDTTNLVHDLARHAQIISLGLQIDETAILLNLDQKIVLARLPVVEEAMFDSHAEEHNPTCLPGTRTDILQNIQDWAENPQAKALFWLNGMAGTGKSTISRTVARLLSGRGKLGASFFFKRGEHGRSAVSRIFPTIAAQLVKREPAIAPYVKEAIDNNSDILGKGIEAQFRRLVQVPFSKVSQDKRKNDLLVIIIDALDECEREEDIRLLITLFSRVHHQDPVKLRVFVTSRPELPIRLGFSKVKGTYLDLTLHTIPDTVVENDLRTYFNHELARIRDDYNNTVSQDRKLPSTWPGLSVIEDLAQIANPLFIFAATVCRFLADRRSGAPNTKLRKVLQYRTKSQESKFDATYLPVLDQMVNGLSEREHKEALEEFRTIVGSIIVLVRPLSTSTLAAVLQVSQDTIDTRLDLLHSVLDIPPSSNLPVKPLHLSFRNFLLDPEKKGRSQFWVEETEMHRQMTKNCLRILNNSLRKDICEVRWPGTLRESIDPKVINKKLPPEVQYACQYWTYHLQESRDGLHKDGPVHNFLQLHSLHWLEALCLLRKGGKALGCIIILLSLSDDRSFPTPALFQIQYLARRYQHCPIPLQIYSEAAVLDWTFEHFSKSDRPHWISSSPKLLFPSRKLSSFSLSTPMAISSDSKFIAGRSFRQSIEIRSLDTGQRQHRLMGHERPIMSIAFSPNAKLLLSTSEDKTARIWSNETGECLQTITLPPNSDFEVSFGLDGRLHPPDVDALMKDDILQLTSSKVAPKDPLVPTPGLTMVKDSGFHQSLSCVAVDGLNLWYFPPTYATVQITAAGGSVIAVYDRDEYLITIVRVDVKRLLGLRLGDC